MDGYPFSKALPGEIISMIFRHVYRLTVLSAIEKDGFPRHHCILEYPCKPLRSAVFSFRKIRAVCKGWNRYYEDFIPHHFYCDRQNLEKPGLFNAAIPMEYNMRRKPHGGFVISYADLQLDCEFPSFNLGV